MSTRKKIAILIIIAMILSNSPITFPITISVNDNTSLIVGSKDFSLIHFFKYFFIHISFVVTHYLLILTFFKFIIRNNIYKIFLDNKKILLLSMYIVLLNSFILNSFSFKQFFSLDSDYTLSLDILSFFAYSLINSFIIIVTNRLVYKFIENQKEV